MKFSSGSLLSMNSCFWLSFGISCPNWCPQRETLDVLSLVSESMFSTMYSYIVGNLVPELLVVAFVGNPVPELLDIDLVGNYVPELLDIAF